MCATTTSNGGDSGRGGELELLQKERETTASLTDAARRLWIQAIEIGNYHFRVSRGDEFFGLRSRLAQIDELIEEMESDA
jgi:hypothetical protein